MADTGKKSQDRTEHLFVVRVWRETVGASSEKWRGSIEHVSTKQRLFFTSLADVHDFIAARLTDVRRAVSGTGRSSAHQPGRGGRVVDRARLESE